MRIGSDLFAGQNVYRMREILLALFRFFIHFLMEESYGVKHHIKLCDIFLCTKPSRHGLTQHGLFRDILGIERGFHKLIGK